jgi:hypothetical protein
MIARSSLQNSPVCHPRGVTFTFSAEAARVAVPKKADVNASKTIFFILIETPQVCLFRWRFWSYKHAQYSKQFVSTIDH